MQKRKYGPFKKVTMVFLFLYISTMYFLSYSESTNFISKFLFAAVLALTVISFFVENKIKKIDYFMIALTIFAFYNLISSIWVVCGTGVKECVFTIFQLVLLFFVIRFNVCTEKDFRVIFWAMFVGTVVMCLYAISFYGFVGVIQVVKNGGRIGNEVNQSNGMGLFCDILAIMCLYLIYWEKKKWPIAVLLLAMFTLVATGSRRAFLLAVLLYLIMFVFKSQKGRLKRFLIIVIIVAFIVYLIYALAEYSVFFQRLFQLMLVFTNESSNLTDGSLITRMSFFTLAMELFLQKPIFGHGPVQFEYYYYLQTNRRRPPHSTFLQVLVGYGIFGFILFYGMYVYAFKKVIPMLKEKRKYSIMIFTMLVIMLVNDIGTNMLSVKILYIIFAFFSSYFAIKLDEEKAIIGGKDEQSLE